MSVRKAILFGVLLISGAATAVTAATTDTVGNSAEHSWHSHANTGMIDRPFLHALHRLNLTADQQQSIHNYLQAARQQSKSNAASRPSFDVLGNPGDPNYATAVAAAKTIAANRVQQRSDLKMQIYGALTPAQQATLPQVLSEMKAQRMQHRADWQQSHQS